MINLPDNLDNFLTPRAQIAIIKYLRRGIKNGIPSSIFFTFTFAYCRARG